MALSYYTVLGFNKEPFSTSPDPEFFYHSLGHDTALKRLEIAIRLRRGLSLIFGQIGAGKTTLLRALLQEFTADRNFVFHVILDPEFESTHDFLGQLTRSLGINPGAGKEAIEQYLFEKGVKEKKTIVLVIDEGQKLSASHIEMLRTLLNYETNEYKLLQLVILAQMEFLPRVQQIPNFISRAALKYMLNPLNERETGEMINFRLKQAGYLRNDLYTASAIKLIADHSQGCPRRIAMLCHDALELLIMREYTVINENIIEELVQRNLIYEQANITGR